jgi:hypothetical protein
MEKKFLNAVKKTINSKEKANFLGKEGKKPATLNVRIEVLSEDIFTEEKPLTEEELKKTTQALEKKHKGKINMIQLTTYVPILHN